jgi:alkylhydroperoxidase family enzyme
MTTDARGVDEELWAELRSHYDEGEIIEMAAVIGLFNYFNRFNDALRVEITRPGTPPRTP